MTDDLPPHDPAAERLTLCGLLVDFEAVWPAVARFGLAAEDFFMWANRVAFARVVECFEARADDYLPRALYHRLRLTGEAADFGGGVGRWVAETLECRPPPPRWDEDEVPAAVWAAVAAGRVRQLAVCRRLIHSAREVLRDARSPCHDPARYERQLAALEVA